MANEYKKYIAGTVLGASLFAGALSIPIYHLIKEERLNGKEVVYSLGLDAVGGLIAAYSLGALVNTRAKRKEDLEVKISKTPQEAAGRAR
jgi:hypothetical protein